LFAQLICGLNLMCQGFPRMISKESGDMNIFTFGKDNPDV
jgi:hypothetical protein